MQIESNTKDNCLQYAWDKLCNSEYDNTDYTIDTIFDNIKDLILRCKENSINNPEYYARIDLEYGDEIPYIKKYKFYSLERLPSYYIDNCVGGVGGKTIIEISDFTIDN